MLSKIENKSKCLRHWGIYWRMFLQAGWCDQRASDVIRDPLLFILFPPLCEFSPRPPFPHSGIMVAEVPGITSSRRREKYNISSSLERGLPSQKVQAILYSHLIDLDGASCYF